MARDYYVCGADGAVDSTRHFARVDRDLQRNIGAVRLPDSPVEKFDGRVSDFFQMRFECEMSRIEEMDFSVCEVAFKRVCTRR
jgi:hypothetical protein